MGELVRRLDYERRSKGMMRNLVGVQRISKEYSTPVRSANAMAERQATLAIKREEVRLKAFMNRHAYEYMMAKKLQKDMDLRTQAFDEDEFNLTRGRTAYGGRFSRISAEVKDTAKKEEDTAVTTAKREKIKSANRDLTLSRGRKNAEKEETEEDKKLKAALPVIDVDHFKDFYGFGYRRRVRSASAANVSGLKRDGLGKLKESSRRRKSSPNRVRSAYIPRHSAARVRKAPRSVSGASSSDDSDEESDEEQGVRTFRELREAYKMKKVEPPNPAQERIKLAKKQNSKASELLNERTLKLFRDIFEDSLLQMDDPDV